MSKLSSDAPLAAGHLRSVGALLLTVAMLALLPLLGLVLGGERITPYLEFPPTARKVMPPPFRWPFFIGIAVVVAGVITPFTISVWRGRIGSVHAPSRRYAVPWWGWSGVVLMLVAWWLAWTRYPWFAGGQPHTFFPLWIGFIVTVNALTYRRTGTCQITAIPLRWLGLFGLSALFWWCFEYLNRFVENWYYVDIGVLSSSEYFWRATLSFSTVLPAVLGLRDYLASFPALAAGLYRGWRFAPHHPGVFAALALLAAAIGLAGVGVWPHLLYPMLWVAPLVVLTALRHFLGLPTLFGPVACGDWRGIWLAALAGLGCGFFWELWNFASLSRWEYAVPYVQRFHLFEMPILGYAGYLPFGLECVTVASVLVGRDPPR